MAKANKTAAPKPVDVRDLRKQKGLNQQAFWSRLGVTQSGGSRYESGRTVPKPVQTLLLLTHGTDAQATALFNQLRGV